MPIAQTTKIRRNALCHCGSGKKYKKCCEKKETKMPNGGLRGIEETREEKMREQKIATPHSLKNKFRDEVQDPYAGIPKDELITRDQAVLMRELRFRVRNGNEDVLHINKAIEKAKALRVELYGYPKSPYREEIINNLAKYIKMSEEKVKTLGPQKSMVLQLLALEELFAEPNVLDAEEISKKAIAADPEDAEAEDELTIPEESAGDGVDEDDNPEETI